MKNRDAIFDYFICVCVCVFKIASVFKMKVYHLLTKESF